MNIDKFGHHVHKRLRLSEYIDNFSDTLVKSESGHFDLKLSKLKGVTAPEQDDEAVNKAYLDKTVQEIREEIKKLSLDVTKYINNLEKVFANRLKTLFYTKTEIDNLIKPSIKNE